MICRQVLGTARDDDPAIDWVEIDWPQTLKRALRLVSNAGRRVDVLLPPGGRLRHRDVLFDDSHVRIAIFLRPCDVLALVYADLRTSTTLALRLGNLHLSVEVAADALYTPADGPAEEVADALKVPFSRVRRRFFPDVGLGADNRDGIG